MMGAVVKAFVIRMYSKLFPFCSNDEYGISNSERHL